MTCEEADKAAEVGPDFKFHKAKALTKENAVGRKILIRKTKWPDASLTNKDSIGWVFTIEEVKPEGRSKSKKTPATYSAAPPVLSMWFPFTDTTDLVPIS